MTDANVVLGRLDGDNFLGGGMSLDEVAARRVIGELARELGLTDREAAEGVITVINANMANAIRSRTVQKGIDPRDYALVAFGGAGPLHGAEVADMLGIPEVIVPPHPGITSAVGLLISDLRYDAIRTSFQVSGAADLARINADFAAMAKELAGRFTADGIDLAQRDVRAPRRPALCRPGLRAAACPSPTARSTRPPSPRPSRPSTRSTAANTAITSPTPGIEIVNLRLVGAASARQDRQAVRGGRRQSLDAARGAQGHRHLPRRRQARRLSDRPSIAATCCRSARSIAGPAIVLQMDLDDRRAAAAQLRSRRAPATSIIRKAEA